MNLTKLLALALEIKSFSGSQTELIPLIREYVSAFSEFESSAQFLTPKQEDKSELEQLNQIHALIIEMVDGLKGDTLAQLKNLRVKGKALRAYVDTLPKRISTTRGRKG